MSRRSGCPAAYREVAPTAAITTVLSLFTLTPTMEKTSCYRYAPTG
ncbi:MAG: hypothetical protein WBK56_06510 [Methanoculleus sp.]